MSLNKRISRLISLLQQRQRENKILIHGISLKHREESRQSVSKNHIILKLIFAVDIFSLSDGNAVMAFSAFHVCISDVKIFLIIESLKYRRIYICDAIEFGKSLNDVNYVCTTHKTRIDSISLNVHTKATKKEEKGHFCSFLL